MTKNKPGKPKKPAKIKQSSSIQVRVTPTEYNEIKSIADELGLVYVSSVARLALRNFVLKHRAAG